MDCWQVTNVACAPKATLLQGLSALSLEYPSKGQATHLSLEHCQHLKQLRLREQLLKKRPSSSVWAEDMYEQADSGLIVLQPSPGAAWTTSVQVRPEVNVCSKRIVLSCCN